MTTTFARLMASLATAAVLFAMPSPSGSSALAQPISPAGRAQTDGVALPPTGVALVDEATALELNPAGMGQLDGFQLHYLHEREVRTDLLGDGVFLGFGLGDGSGAGFAMQWMRPAGQARYRKTSWSLALGPEVASVGASYNLFSSDDRAIEDLSSFDLGVQARPLRFLSLGASVKDLDTPSLHGVRLERRYAVGIGLRPANARVSLSAEALFDGRGGIEEARPSFALLLEPAPGAILQVGAAQSPAPRNEWFGQVGITLNADFAGFGYTVGGGEPKTFSQHLFQVRLSQDRYRSLKQPMTSFVVIDPAERLTPAGGFAALLAGESHDPYLELLATLDRLREDPAVGGVLLKLSSLGELGAARFEELRAAIERLRASGKRPIALVFEAGDGEYLLASACERVWAVPQATFLVNGFSASGTYFAEGLAKLGVTVDVARVGEYKTAPESFVRSDMSPAQRETLDAFLDGLSSRFLAALSKARNQPEARLREAMKAGILTAQQAQQFGLVDAVLYPDELPKQLESAVGRSVRLVDEDPERITYPRKWGEPDRIALIHVNGLIAEGRSRSEPLGGARIAGAESLVKALERASADRSVRAVVLRVESGGGSGAASDLIWRAVRKLRERKPVIASMGDVAASGGYYVAMGADEVLAEATTLTGSIGVFALKPSFAPLLAKLGIRRETLRRGESADFLSLARPWTPDEQRSMQRYVDDFYGQFIAKVAESRGLSRERVDEIARGRVWTGEAARERKLVDRIGGLSEAIQRAKERAGLVGRDVDVEVFAGEEGLFELPFAAAASAAATPDAGGALKAVRSVVGAEGLALFELGDGPLALMPFALRVE